MTYYHWALDPVKLRGMRYPQSGHPKPNGLWFDVNGSWKQWCEAVQFRPEGLRYRHTVTVLDTSRILFLRKAKDIDLFAYGCGHHLSGNIQPLQGYADFQVFALQYGINFFNRYTGTIL